MVIELRLFATLRGYLPANPTGVEKVELPENATVMDIVNKLGINFEEIRLILVNGILNEADYVLKDGDRVALFPPVGGG